MKTVDASLPLAAPLPVAVPEAITPTVPSTLAVAWTNVLDWLMLIKPRLTLMVLFTVAVGFVLGSSHSIDVTLLIHALVGTSLVAAGASAFNQVLERETDAAMRRTRNRPLPAGRMSIMAAFAFGVATSVAGVVYVGVLVNLLTVAIAALTLVSYVLAYTPLKRRSTANTLVGAIPGALPPVIGWTAASGTLSLEAVALFLVLFFWQFPHFWSIVWLYRQDYARAGLKMLPLRDAEGGVMTGRLMVRHCLVLVAASLLPALVGPGNLLYLTAALLLGLGFLWVAARFRAKPTTQRARQALWASLAYLPLILSFLLLAKVNS